MKKVSIPDFFEWAATGTVSSSPWLILGKGPSFSELAKHDTSKYRRLSLNHAVRETPVDIAHIIDLDVVEACADALRHNARVVVIPWRPHVRHEPTQDTLDTFCERIPVLAELQSQGRLLTYNLLTGKRLGHRDGFPEVPVVYFSFEAAFNLLAMAGVRVIRSLGVDGGASYSDRFADLRDKTLLANGHASFNAQFAEVAKSVRRFGTNYAPLNLESPVRVYVAATDDQMLSVKVLEYSLRKYSCMPVEVVPLHTLGIDIRTPLDPKNIARTPFSFQRFLIPQARGYTGRAIYMDSDMQVFRDVRELWSLSMGDNQLLAVGDTLGTGRKPQFSVMLLDCARLDWDIDKIIDRLDAGDLTYEQLMQDMAVAEQIGTTIPPEWNSLEHFEEGRTALLHYTDMHLQPWVSRNNSLGHIWMADLLEGVSSGFIPRSMIDEHIQLRYVRPSIAYQLDHGITDPLLLPRKARVLDESFVPPFMRMPAYGRVKIPKRSSWSQIRLAVEAKRRALRSLLSPQ